MADITICINDECPIKESCWRYNATPNEYWQSVAKYEPVIDEVSKEVECDNFISMVKEK